MLKSVFGTNVIAEIHSSLNNIDKLRYLIARVQKQQNPHGQGILGVVYDFNQNTQEIKNYIQKSCPTWFPFFFRHKFEIKLPA